MLPAALHRCCCQGATCKSAPAVHVTPPCGQVFKAARALAPSVVLLEGAEQVFVLDRTRARALAGPGGEPPNRIRKQLLAEVRPGLGRSEAWSQSHRLRRQHGTAPAALFPARAAGASPPCTAHPPPLLPLHPIQVSALEPGDGVLVLCTSSQPQVGRDQGPSLLGDSAVTSAGAAGQGALALAV